MNSNRPPLEFRVVNPFRIAIFVLLIVELFLIETCLFRSPWQVVAILETVIAIGIVLSIPGFRRIAECQILDCIRLQDVGVEYSSGAFGDSWIRPYTEFRVDVRKQGLLFPLFRVWLKHRVLPNTVVQTTFDQVSAEQTAGQIVENSRLKMLRR